MAEAAGYDFIGDVHGQGGKLERLLRRLGYRCRNGVYGHPERQAVFLGDLIDRGPEQRRVLEMVRPMVLRSHARLLLGNHEFNAICYHTRDPGRPGHWLRPHCDRTRRQHAAFLAEYPLGGRQTGELIRWFKSLPLWLELGGGRRAGPRAIHACWDPASIRLLAAGMRRPGFLDDALILRAARVDSPQGRALEVLLKGPELPLPAGAGFRDKDGVPRQSVRYRWWQPELRDFRRAALVPEAEAGRIPELPLPEGFCHAPYPAAAPPLFFGHYWFTGAVRPLGPNLACLDYSAGKDGPLVAYRWSPQPAGPLRREGFVIQQ